MSSPNGSLANLLVTRKSFHATDNRTPLARNLGCPFPVPFRQERMTGWREAASKKSRRWKGAGASSKKPAQKTRRKWAKRIFSPPIAARGFA
jgi:hypothetical protein